MKLLTGLSKSKVMELRKGEAILVVEIRFALGDFFLRAEDAGELFELSPSAGDLQSLREVATLRLRSFFTKGAAEPR